MVEIVGVNKDSIDFFWPKIEEFLQAALDEASDEMSIEDVYNWVLEDRYILLVIVENGEPVAASTLEVQDYPNKRKLGVVLLGGNGIKEWFPEYWETIKKIGKSVEANSITWLGREGWKRFMKQYVTKIYIAGEVAL